MIYPRLEANMSTSTEVIFFLHILKTIFLITFMGAMGYSCPIRFVSTYILPAIEIRLI